MKSASKFTLKKFYETDSWIQSYNTTAYQIIEESRNLFNILNRKL